MLRSNHKQGMNVKWKMTLISLAAVTAALLAAGWLAVRFSWGQKELDLAAAAILFLAAVLLCVRNRKQEKGRRLLPALLRGAALCAALLMLGFLIGGEAMSASGLLRVVLPCFLGALVGALLSSRGGASRRVFPARNG